MTDCPDQQVQNVQEAVRKQYGCQVPTYPRGSLVLSPRDQIGVLVGLAVGILLMAFFKSR